MVRASTIFAFLIGGAIVFVWRQIRYTNVQHIEAERKVERKVYAEKLESVKNRTFRTRQTTKFPIAQSVTKPQIIKPIVIMRPKPRPKPRPEPRRPRPKPRPEPRPEPRPVTTKCKFQCPCFDKCIG